MPELPEVETMRRGIRRVAGARISAACFPQGKNSRLKPIVITPKPAVLGRRIKNRVVETVDRIGKRVCLRLDSGDSLVFEPRMTGLLLVQNPPDDEHVRFGLEFENGPIPSIWYWDRRGLGNVNLYDPAQLQARLGPERLGPDALLISVSEMRARLVRSRRAIKVALLDQKAISGIGNLYASEILHLAGMHPAKQCNRIPAAAWQVLHSAMNQVLRTAIKYEGSTLADGTYRNALNQNGSYQNQHQVYNRADMPCPRCQDAIIVRIVQAQRSTFFCKKCQRKRLTNVSGPFDN